MGGHFEGVTCGIELWHGGEATARFVAGREKLSVVSRPAAMLDEVTTPSPESQNGSQQSCGQRKRMANGERGCL